MRNEFKAPRWLRNRHLQTIISNIIWSKGPVETRNERLELPDGDFLDLAWAGEHSSKENSPIIVILHGLTGSSQSTYVQRILAAVVKQNWRAVVVHFRGCGDELNRHFKSYHAGKTEDLDFVIQRLHEREPLTPLVAVGYSLGGNILLKHLGEVGQASLISTAVGVSVPYDLGKTSKNLSAGFSSFYQKVFLRRLIKVYRKKVHMFRAAGGDVFRAPLDHKGLKKLKSLFQFDDLVTAPLNGFANADEYYATCSSRQFLKEIQIPTLLIHADDDPFMARDSIPTAEELSDSTTFELSQGGGHIGFISGCQPFRLVYWLEERIIAYIASQMASN